MENINVEPKLSVLDKNKKFHYEIFKIYSGIYINYHNIMCFIFDILLF